MFVRYDMGIYDLVVKRIYELCAEREITPNALSYLSGISQSTIKSILNGESKNPGIVTIKKICLSFRAKEKMRPITMRQSR